MEDGIHEVAGAVAGEGTAGAVGAVGAGGKAEDENSSPVVAEARDRTSPIGLILIGSAFGFADAPAVVPKAAAPLASGDGFVNLLK